MFAILSAFTLLQALLIAKIIKIPFANGVKLINEY